MCSTKQTGSDQLDKSDIETKTIKSKRQPFVPTEALGKLWRAIIEFDMLQPGDRILIGLSGGKDSMLLTAMLAEIKRYSPIPFDLACYTVNGMFDDSFPKQQLQEFCARYGLEHYSDDVDIATAQKQTPEMSPCYTCAFFRRGATNRRAKELGFNKVALAHHNDDAVETFFMNVMTSGQLRTFLPVTHLTRTGITVLRPLLYYREYEIRSLVKKIGLQPLKNPCPFDGFTNRQSVKDHIRELNSRYPEVYEHLASAMRTAPGEELWPAKPCNKELKAKFNAFWQKKR